MERPVLVFLVNGAAGDAMGIRARSFAQRLDRDFKIHVAYRPANKVYAILHFWWRLVRAKPSVCYIFDIGFSGVLAAGLYRLCSRCRMVVDTGDAIYELSRSSGSRG